MKQSMENLELRSEKVRKIIGQTPPVIMRIGITITAFVVAALIVATAMIHYPKGSDHTLMEIIIGE